MRQNSIKMLLAIIVPLFFIEANISAQSLEEAQNGKLSQLQKFYYNLGKKQSKSQYFKQGYDEALRDFSTLLSRYDKKIKALEAGKYLIESGQITYPEIYKERVKGGSYVVHILPPTIESELSASELFLLPMINGTVGTSGCARKKVQSYMSSVEVEREENEITNNFFIPSLSNIEDYKPLPPSELSNGTSLTIGFKGSKIEEFLSTSNVKYTTTESGYTIDFKDEGSKRKFCTELTGDSSCYGLN